MQKGGHSGRGPESCLVAQAPQVAATPEIVQTVFWPVALHPAILHFFGLCDRSLHVPLESSPASGLPKSVTTHVKSLAHGTTGSFKFVVVHLLPFWMQPIPSLVQQNLASRRKIRLRHGEGGEEARTGVAIKLMATKTISQKVFISPQRFLAMTTKDCSKQEYFAGVGTWRPGGRFFGNQSWWLWIL